MVMVKTFILLTPTPTPTTIKGDFFILCFDQQMHNYLTNYHTPTRFDTVVSSSGSL